MGYTREYFIGFICFWIGLLIMFIFFHSLLATQKVLL
jgi:hypothetical protein